MKKQNIISEKIEQTHKIRTFFMLFMFLLSGLLLSTAFSDAQVQLPAIPSNMQLSNSFEFDADYIYRVSFDGAYLEDGALIAYVDGKLRGAQTSSVLFNETNTVVYKIRLFSNSAQGENITFKYYDLNHNKIYDITETQAFQADNVPDFRSPQVLNAYCGVTGKPGGMIPEDAVTGVDISLNCYWQPADNATRYSMFLWKEGDNVPASAYRSDIYGTSTGVNGLEFGTEYHWFVVAKNQCGSDTSVISSFTVRNLPDLTVSSVTIPDTVISSESFGVEFSIHNAGDGATRSGHSWYNGVYISQDNILSDDDILAGKVICNQALEADSSVTQTCEVTVPVDYAGDYHVFVKADIYSSEQETDDNNNSGEALTTLAVKAKPLPDILIETIFADKMSYEPGDTITVSWTVKNAGAADAIGGWSEKISLLSLTGIRVELSGYPAYSGILKKDSTVDRSFIYVVPELPGFAGDANIEVSLFPSGDLIEFPGNDANNTSLSTGRVELAELIYLKLPFTEIKENYSGNVRCYVTRSGNTTSEMSVDLSASVPGLINIPASATISNRNSTGMFEMSTVDNTLLDGTKEFELAASATGIKAVSKHLKIIDDEVPALSVTALPDSVSEGDTLNVIITRDLLTGNPLTVYVSTDKSSQMSFPSTVEIPGGLGEVKLPVVITDDNIPEITGTVKLMIRSEGYSSVSSSTVILDDDIPVLELELANDTVAESGGPYATTATIRRTQPRNSRIKVNISTDIANALYFPASITLNANEMAKQFNVGVIDNTLVDGFRDINITGSVYISSCGCSASSESGGKVTARLTIIDNDGPSFTVTVNPASWKEGIDDAGKVTIFRNTGTSGNQIVNLSVNDTSELELPATVTIPAGETTVQVSGKTKDDGKEDGNQMVNIKAEAEGFSPGVASVIVTDINKADLEMTDLELSDYSVVANGYLRVQSQIMNNGYGTASTGVKINFYLSKDDIIGDTDSLIYTASIDEPLYAGKSVAFIEVIPIPGLTGSYNLIAKINPGFKVSELVYSNNDAVSDKITILPEYTGTANTDIEVLNVSSPVTITGKALSDIGDPLSGTKLDVYVLSNGFRRVLEVITDDNGEYSVDFEPTQFETGHFVIGACYPGQDVNEEQDSFDIIGIERVSNDYFVWKLRKGVALTGVIKIKNRSNVPLHNVSVWSDEFPEGCVLTVDTVGVLGGNETVDLHYSVMGEVLSEKRRYNQFSMKLFSSDGAESTFPCFYYCQAENCYVQSIPASINTTITKGGEKYYEFNLINSGAGETGKMSVELPKSSFLSLVSNDTIKNLYPGDTTKVTLMMKPEYDFPLNLPVSGNIVINITNGDDILIPFQLEVVSENKGSLSVDVIDEYTYFAEDAPHVADAHVVVRHPFSGEVIGEGFTDSTGVFMIDSVFEGNYVLSVEKEQHEYYRDNVSIDPGRTNNKSVFLSFQAITYSWDVVETDIEDEYNIDLVMEFETNVPVPVIVLDVPDVMPVLIEDETFTFMVTITNKGLITAKNVMLEINPTDDNEFKWDYYKSVFDLYAQQSVQIPVTMKVRNANASSGKNQIDNLKSVMSADCKGTAVVYYQVECGPDFKNHLTKKSFNIGSRSCPEGGSVSGGGGGGILGGLGSSVDYSGGATDLAAFEEFNDCDPCLASLAGALISCGIGPFGDMAGLIITITSCIVSGGDGWDTADLIGCIPFLPGGCPVAIAGALECYVFTGAGSHFLGNVELKCVNKNTSDSDDLPPILKQMQEDVNVILYLFSAKRGYFNELMGDSNFKNKESIDEFLILINEIVDNNQSFADSSIFRIKQYMSGMDITEQEIDYFVNRWNRTIEARALGITSPNNEYPNIVSQMTIDSCNAAVDSVYSYAFSRGFVDVGDLYVNTIKDLKEYVEGERNSVCASVSIKISQSLVMTREAFEGTLTIYNGSDSIPMKDINLNLEIRNDEGEICNDLFEIETKALDILTGIDGLGTLEAGKKGSATIIFIPEKGAAPTVPESYSFGGSFSYVDPFTGLVITRNLSPVTLEVDPSPNLYLHYFMQRDILGDDALTEVVEPIVPAELAVMIENNGYGEARNVRIESAQPEIIDNEKGLAINFALVGSNLNGQPRQLGLTNINFGNIAPKKTAIGQWWFTSDLLGHFVKYNTKVTHLDSRGNPDLSLVSGAKLHELIKSIRVYKSGLDDGINDFLVNEVQDVKERPDAIYMSQGNVVLDVFGADAGEFENQITAPDYTTKLKVVTSKVGWNCFKLPDPGKGCYDIVSVTRDWDGQVIPLENAWLTFVTLPDGKEPVYENMFHIVDDMEVSGEHEYTIVWKQKEKSALKIVFVSGIPESMKTSQLKDVIVRFNKAVDPSSFSWEDMTLRLQGGEDIMSSAVTVTEIDSVTYNVDLSAVTTGNGYYVLNIQTVEISDINGIKGRAGKLLGWTQFLTVPAIEEFIGIPDSIVTESFDYVMIRFNMPVDAYTVIPDRFVLQRYGKAVSVTLTVTQMDMESRLFKIEGLGSAMVDDGEYSLIVDLTKIANLDGEKGLIQQSASWSIDTTPPHLVSFTPDSDNGFDGHHYSGFAIEFTETVTDVDVNSVELWKDGMQQPLSQVHFDYAGNNGWYLSQFRLLTYYEGSYVLKVDMTKVVDGVGHTGSGVKEFSWTVDRSKPLEANSLRISPDLGYSDHDNITSATSFDVIASVPENNVTVEIYRNDFGKLTLLSSKDNVQSGEVAVPVLVTSSGNVTIEVHVVNASGDFSVAQLDVVVDQTAFDAVWEDITGNSYHNHPVSLQFTVSEKLVETTPDVSLLKLMHNGSEIPLTGVTILQTTDNIYSIIGLDGLGNDPGDYILSVDLTGLHKYRSGLQGTHSVPVSWTITRVNKVPIADAGSDFYVEPGKQYQLNASGSSDPDGDNLTYKWFPPDGIILDNEFSAYPEFTAPVVNSDTVFTFVVMVSDGYETSTDKVNVFYSSATGTDLKITDDNIILYPNPCITQFTLYTGKNNIESIKLIDMSGALLIMKKGNGDKEQTIRIGALQKGVYIVQIKTDEKTINRKLLVK